MGDEVLYDLGVDLGSDFVFVDGDIKLSEYKDNLVQGVVNRLNTDLNELDWFYEEYGSILTRFLGWKATDETLEFIKSEITNVLGNEVRLVGHECDLRYVGNGVVRIDLVLYPNQDIFIPLNLVLTTDGVFELELDENIMQDEV